MTKHQSQSDTFIYQIIRNNAWEAIMSDTDIKKPESREEFIKTITETVKKITEYKAALKPKPTISGTAKALNIHRDTLYTWLKEFSVDFKEIANRMPTYALTETVEDSSTYLIGEALLGEGNELAHIDLLIGDKDGPVGKAFASGLSNLWSSTSSNRQSRRRLSRGRDHSKRQSRRLGDSGQRVRPPTSNRLPQNVPIQLQRNEAGIEEGIVGVSFT